MAGGALEQRVALLCGQRRKIRGVAFDKGPEETLQRQVQMREVHTEKPDPWASGGGVETEKAESKGWAQRSHAES